MKPNYRARCARINNALMKAYGSPQWDGQKDPLDVLVQTVLGQLASVRVAGKTWTALKSAHPTWETMMDVKPETAARVLNRAGLAITKARTVVRLIQKVKKEFGTMNLDFVKTMSVREAMRALSSLDGVDQQTSASVILSSLGREVVPVDGDIHRVLTRMGIIINSTDPGQAFEVLQPLVPRGHSYVFYVNLGRLAREVCKASRQRCPACPVEAECRYPAKNLSRRGRR